MDLRDRIIAALDVRSLQEVEALVKELVSHISYFKIGLQLQTWVGAPRVVEFVHRLGGNIFFDGKFNDIPNTMGEAAAAISALGVAMFDVHASAGRKSVEAAVAHKGGSLVLGVTVLTSIGEEECVSIFGDQPGPKVLQFSRMLKEVGADGIICSPQELVLLSQQPELAGLRKVTPGIRPRGSVSDDQKRIMTPGEAILADADQLVIGRPITDPPKEIGRPADAVQRILDEIATALERRA